MVDEEVNKLSGSQFSLSVRGTPTFHRPASPREKKKLRDKLLLVTTELNAKREKIRQAEEIENKAAKLRDSISVASRSSHAKRKTDDASTSSYSDKEDKGAHALDLFLKTIRKKVECAEQLGCLVLEFFCLSNFFSFGIELCRYQ